MLQYELNALFKRGGTVYFQVS